MPKTFDGIIYSDDLKKVTDVADKSITTAVIKEGVTTIKGAAFWGCKNLQSVTIPDSVTTIDNRAFGFCENLQNVTIPDSVTIIKKGTFQDCKNLQSVTIPNSVKVIGENAFAKDLKQSRFQIALQKSANLPSRNARI